MLDPSTRDRQSAVFRHLQKSILAGVLRPGARLPPTRAIAEQLGVARQTAVLAYERLAAEGYVLARIGVGTFVAPDLAAILPENRPETRPETRPDARPDARTHPVPLHPTQANQPTLSRRGAAIAETPASASHDSPTLLLAPGIPSPELFPTRQWAACLAAAARDHLLAGYPDPQGLPALRAQIAHHLAATRGLVTDPHHILITAGTQQALRLAAELLIDPGDSVWVEDPGYIAGRGAMQAAGATLVPVPSGPAGLDVAAGRRAAPRARLALVAPSHATPLGGAMPIAQRLALLEWAQAAGAWVLEDDCDTEFRWEGKPLPPLATLDHPETGQTIYCGTFSKTLAPALRLGFAIFPPALIRAATRARTLWDRGPSTPVQAALAEFMRRGLLAPHIRRARTEYAARRAALLDALARHCPAITPIPAPGGLHLTLQLPPNANERHADEHAIARTARALGLGVAPLAAYRIHHPGPPGLVAGFAATPTALAAGCARRLHQALETSSQDQRARP